MQSIFTVILTIVAVPGGYAQWICIPLVVVSSTEYIYLQVWGFDLYGC